MADATDERELWVPELQTGANTWRPVDALAFHRQDVAERASARWASPVRVVRYIPATELDELRRRVEETDAIVAAAVAWREHDISSDLGPCDCLDALADAVDAYTGYEQPMEVPDDGD